MSEGELTTTPGEGPALSKNEIYQLLRLACLSKDEEKMRNILSENDCTDCLKSKEGSVLLIAMIFLLKVNIAEENLTLSEKNSSKIHMICKLLLEHGVTVNVELQIDTVTATPLHLAVAVNSEEIVKMLLSSGAAVNKQNSGGVTPLDTAIRENYLNVAQILLENGADAGNCDDVDVDDFTALHIAVYNGHKEIVKMLLSKGAAVSSKNHDYDTPMPCDVLKNFKNISQLFLENPNNPDNLGNLEHRDDFLEQTITPLHCAVLKENKEIAEILLSNGVNVNATNNQRNTALHYAVCENSVNIAQLLLANGANLDIRNKLGHKPFGYNKCLQMKRLYSLYRIKMYLDNGGTIEETDDDGYTLLHHAVKYNSKDVILFLLNKGCNLNAVTKLGESPIHLSVQNGNEEITLLLLQKGCDVNATTSTGCTPLHLEVNYTVDPKEYDDSDSDDDIDEKNRYSDNENLLKILIENGANKEIKNQLGYTPLNYAVRNQLPRKAEILLGENPDICDKALKMEFCLTFFDHEDSSDSCRRYNKKVQCLSQLFYNLGFRIGVLDFGDMHIPNELYSDWLSKSADQNFRSIVHNFLNEEATSNTIDTNRLFIKFQVLVGAVKHGFVDIFLNLFTPYMDINAPLEEGNTLLHFASLKGNLTIVKKLLLSGATVNSRNDKKECPLYFSVRKGHDKVTKHLLDNGADIDARDESDNSPLLIELEEPTFSRVRVLLEYGADVNCIQNEESPLHSALFHYETNIVKLLFHYGAFANPSDSFKVKPIYSFFEDYGSGNFEIHKDYIKLLFNYGANVIHLPPNVFRDHNEYAKYKVKSLEANLERFDFFVDSAEVAEFQTKCREEVVKMKLTKIGGCNVSMYDLLVKTQRQTAMYMRNANVVEILQSMKLQKTYPIYAGKLRVCIRRGILENRLLDLSYECLEVILKRKLPQVVVDEIISFLNTSDLHRLIIVSPIDEERKSSVKYSSFVKSLRK